MTWNLNPRNTNGMYFIILHFTLNAELQLIGCKRNIQQHNVECQEDTSCESPHQQVLMMFCANFFFWKSKAKFNVNVSSIHTQIRNDYFKNFS